ncbi:MAG: hypothetical protein WBM13_15440 [Bacteroidia bacterium]
MKALVCICLFALIFLFASFNSHKHKDYLYSEIQTNNLIVFTANSVELSPEGKMQCDSLGQSIISNKIVDKYKILLSNASCIAEVKLNPYIGVCRAKNIIDYITKKYSISRAAFYIFDNDSLKRLNDKDCLNGKYKGIEISLIKNEQSSSED